MQLFRSILAVLTLGGVLSLATGASHAQTNDLSRSDEAVLDMAQAYKQHDRKRLSNLLSAAKGSPLEHWAAYWELSTRLDEASKTEIEGFLSRYAGSYQEDRLRADWLLQLGRNRDWPTFRQQFSQYRMGDDRAIQCYGLWSDWAASGADVAAAVQAQWLSLREPEEACAGIAEELIKAKNSPPRWPGCGHGWVLKTTVCASPPKRLAR